MPGTRGGISADQLAREYGVTLNDFAEEVSTLLARWDSGAAGDRSALRRREICAAVSAAMTAALDASTLTVEERQNLNPLLKDVLVPFWSKHCESDTQTGVLIAERSTHYLAGRVAGSQVKTAVNIVAALLEAIEIPQPHRAALALTLTPSFAHRIVGDLYRINDLRAKHGLELSLLATVCVLCQMSMTSDAILRVLRLA
jgi:hypothetical protein